MTETKANLLPMGCFARALPDEPMFILLARDRVAPDAIKFWADKRSQLAIEEGWSEDAERISDALETAQRMDLWRAEHCGAWRDAPLTFAPTEADLGDIALKILRRGKAMGIDPAAIPDCGMKMVSVEAFNTLLADAQKLAAYVAHNKATEVQHA